MLALPYVRKSAPVSRGRIPLWQFLASDQASGIEKPTKMIEIRNKIKTNTKLNVTVLAETRKQEQDGKYYETDALIHPDFWLFMLWTPWDNTFLPFL